MLRVEQFREGIDVREVAPGGDLWVSFGLSLWRGSGAYVMDYKGGAPTIWEEEVALSAMIQGF